MDTNNVVWHNNKITKEDRTKRLGYKNKVIWLTGLPSSGKSTIGMALETELHKQGVLSYVLDGDNVRHGLNKGLGFSKEDRQENIRRIGEVAKLFHDAGVFVILSFIGPYKKDRDDVRNLIGYDFIEVFVKCSLEECQKRDPKGHYKKAMSGEIKNFTGISAPYEEPKNSEIIIETDIMSVQECVDEVLNSLVFK